MTEILKAAEITTELLRQIRVLKTLHSEQSWAAIMYPIKAILRHKMKEFGIGVLDAAMDEAGRALKDPAAPATLPILFFGAAVEIIREDKEMAAP